MIHLRGTVTHFVAWGPKPPKAKNDLTVESLAWNCTCLLPGAALVSDFVLNEISRRCDHAGTARLSWAVCTCYYSQMYWSDCGGKVGGRIERASLDGTERQLLISQDIICPDGLALGTILYSIKVGSCMHIFHRRRQLSNTKDHHNYGWQKFSFCL